MADLLPIIFPLSLIVLGFIAYGVISGRLQRESKSFIWISAASNATLTILLIVQSMQLWESGSILERILSVGSAGSFSAASALLVGWGLHQKHLIE